MKTKFKKDHRIHSGYRVIGNNTSNGAISIWHFPDLQQAKLFAESLIEDTERTVEIYKYVGSYRVIRKIQPTEYVEATDLKVKK